MNRLCGDTVNARLLLSSIDKISFMLETCLLTCLTTLSLTSVPTYNSVLSTIMTLQFTHDFVYRTFDLYRLPILIVTSLLTNQGKMFN